MIDIVVMTESGEHVKALGDETRKLSRLLNLASGSKGCCLPYIDQYGDTVFNRLQVEVFLKEWLDLVASAKEEERSAALLVGSMARFVGGNPHHYLKFIGD